MPTVDAIRDRLARVTDPELDQSIVELGYIDEIDVDDRSEDAAVTVRFTLPTAWCSPAFAWMMATDARDEVESLQDVSRVRIQLRDHMHDEEINRGVDERLSFGEVFPDADGGVEAIRATLDDKARVARQYDAVEALLDAGVAPEQLCRLTPSDLDLNFDDEADRAAVELDDGALIVTVDAAPLRRYVRKARTVGVVTDEEPLFRTPEGDPIDPAEFEIVHRRGRLAQTNMSGQAGICEALNESRRRKLGREPPETADAD
jgi:metal-sulfur cluster biosynthetic enzyme